MSARRQFGVSTHLYHRVRLGREHFLEIAAHGFEAVEVFATRTHIDYHNPAAVADLQQWLAEAGLELHAIHAPITDGYVGGRPGLPLSIASADADARCHAVGEAERALHIARRIPAKVLVTHLGVPRSQRTEPPARAVYSPLEQPRSSGSGAAAATDDGVRPCGDSRDAARRSVEELQRLAEPLGVRVAVEVIPNELSRVGSLVHFVEEDLDAPSVGICLDFGHAHMDGDLVEAVETVSGHLISTHVHDNRGRTDDHLVPFDGTIDWPSALTAIQKIGYDGTLVFELAAHGSARETLVRAQKARQRMERLLVA